jgi:SWI/SNF-related matrix-associated actin-dependent regulator of chromatin subfamily A3
MHFVWPGKYSFSATCYIKKLTISSVLEVIARDPKCPMVSLVFWRNARLDEVRQDRRPISAADLVEPRPPTELTQAPIRRAEDDSSGAGAGNSAKIDQLIRLLKLTPTTEKSLVFSQFTSFLDRV